MGRGGYDLTDPAKKPSSMAAATMLLEAIGKQQHEKATAEKAAEEQEMKLIKNKKSRGIMAARRLEKAAAAKSKSHRGG